MARIQILELPTLVVGDAMSTPFALVIDQVEAGDIVSVQDDVIRTAADLTQDAANDFAARVGAVGAILTRYTLDVA
ncbi:hypothetical protein [Microbacterium sp. CH-015]|uniref:hypothetical protein n=1 Tax=Microbacterium sp. CH-015 TaxID=3406734 RepID=UPI003C78BCC8